MAARLARANVHRQRDERRRAGNRVAATAKISVTTMIGSMAPADITATRLLGMSATSQSRNEGTASWGIVLAERSASAASGSTRTRAKIAGATSRVAAAIAARVIAKNAIPLAPSLPRPVPPELTPVNRSVVTSGITMSWSARVQIVPIGLSHLVYVEATVGYVPHWLPFRKGWAYLTGAGQIASGLGVLLNVLPRVAAWAEAGQITLYTLLVWLPAIVAARTRLNWTAFFISWIFGAAAWAVAQNMPAKRGGTQVAA